MLDNTHDLGVVAEVQDDRKQMVYAGIREKGNRGRRLTTCTTPYGRPFDSAQLKGEGRYGADPGADARSVGSAAAGCSFAPDAHMRRSAVRSVPELKAVEAAAAFCSPVALRELDFSLRRNRDGK